MHKRLFPTFLLIAYSTFLTQLLIFKTVSFKIGHLMFNFTGQITGPANLVPFKTIVPYLLLEKGLMITIFELAGNIGLFIPIGFLLPWVFPKITCQKSFILAVTFPLAIEIIQVVFRVGIFDIDDILLNSFGIMIGYSAFIFFKLLRSRKIDHSTDQD